MARLRRSNAREAPSKQTVWRVGKYIRLSRDDGNVVSESVVNQNKILDDEIPRFFEAGLYQVVDAYIDDGTSGTSDRERNDFQRMVADIQAGRVNCVIVKNLSRAFRNSADQGRFLEEFLPLYGVRFISLYQPCIDTYLDPEVVHGLEVGITGFMNEQYAYKISADIRRTFKHKRENGEFIGAFAPYGYIKDPQNKNALIIDEDAAPVIRDIFAWFVTGGMSKRGIARRLNDLGTPNPTAYKQARGLRYNNPHAGQNDGLWSPTTVSRILQNPLYTGVMRQGMQRVISYKVHKRTSVPESEWFVVEDAVPPIVSREIFDAAQALHGRDTRTPSGTREVYLFSGLLRCAGCGKSMTRHAARGRVYYHCRTRRDKGGCAKHSIHLDALESAVLTAIQRQIGRVSSLPEIAEKINNAPAAHSEPVRLNALLQLRTKELAGADALLDGLYTDWKNGDISREQYRRMREEYAEKADRLRAQVEHIRSEIEVCAQSVTAEDPYLTAFLAHRNIQSLSRGLVTELVDAISIHQGGAVEIHFSFADPCQPRSEISPIVAHK